MDRTDCLVCPHCRGSLLSRCDEWQCESCATSYRGLRGIADLRTSDDIYLANRADWEIARQLDESYDRLDFRGFLEHYYDLCPEIPADLRRRQIAHILSAPERAGRWLDELGAQSRGMLLDLGCGTGSFLAAAGEAVPFSWGIDIALRWLLVAKKRLEEDGLTNMRLVCGCAERLPFLDHSFSRIIAGDVIEHVSDQSACLAEAHRVLVPGGAVFLASPNRFSLAPEPHVQVWGVGFLPRRWMAPYVRWRRGIDFRAIRTLGRGEWRRLLNETPFGGGEIRCPTLPEADLSRFSIVKRGVARIYNALVATRLGQAIGLRVGPLFHVVCRRPDAAAQMPNRSIHQYSTSTGVPGRSARS